MAYSPTNPITGLPESAHAVIARRPQHDDQPNLAPGANRVIPGTIPGSAGTDGPADHANPLGRQRPQY